MPTQAEIAEHLDLSQQAVSKIMRSLGVDYQGAPMAELRVAYIRNLRGQASGHRSEDGMDLIRERVLSERVDRQLKLLQIGEKIGQLVPKDEVQPKVESMIVAARTEILAAADRIVTEVHANHGVRIELELVERPLRRALDRLSGYADGSEGDDDSSCEAVGATA